MGPFSGPATSFHMRNRPYPFPSTEPDILMRKLGLCLFLAALTAVVFVGCSEDNKIPYFTLLHASSECGVAPLTIEFKASATGGNPFYHPTGCNNWLEITCDFDDGEATAAGSIVYHTFNEPGLYHVVVQAKDKDGDLSDPDGEYFIDVREDTLAIQAAALLDTTVVTEAFTCEEIQFNVVANSCGFDPETGDYFRFIYNWDMDDDDGTIHTGRSPLHTYGFDEAGQHTVVLRLVDPSKSTTRIDTVRIDIISGESDLEVTKSVDNATPNEAETINYRILVANNGPDDCYGIAIRDILPSRVTYVSDNPSKGDYDPESGIWEIGRLLTGRDVVLTITANVDAGTSGTTITNRAAVYASSRCDLNPDNDSSDAVIVVQ